MIDRYTANLNGSMPTSEVTVDSNSTDAVEHQVQPWFAAYRLGEETAATDYTTGWLKEFLDTATLADLQKFAERMLLNGPHAFESVFEDVTVPFTTEDDAENFRAGYMNAVWSHVSGLIAMMEEESRFTAEPVTVQTEGPQ